ncbi:hypothetical protein L916_03421 [Phytophthora nicotianae]|uniref:Uncharacterized protein n=1 Tax=Phytophthora nicotianae TaxID=4792 RepID=W2JK28_PHYNI|nr:hypothetical protein L916_03421 [Phytophthora nicotianae]
MADQFATAPGILKVELVLAMLVPVPMPVLLVTELVQVVLLVLVLLAQEVLPVLVGWLELVALDVVSSEDLVPVVSSVDLVANLAVAWAELTGASVATVLAASVE